VRQQFSDRLSRYRMNEIWDKLIKGHEDEAARSHPGMWKFEKVGVRLVLFEDQ